MFRTVLFLSLANHSSIHLPLTIEDMNWERSNGGHWTVIITLEKWLARLGFRLIDFLLYLLIISPRIKNLIDRLSYAKVFILIGLSVSKINVFKQTQKIILYINVK